MRGYQFVVTSVALAATLAMLACAAPAPGVIHYDTDACDHCRMTIADPKFAAQLVTRTGKIYRFDDPACLASFVQAGRVEARDTHGIWLNDYAHPESRVTVTEAVFVVSDRVRAPMNGGAAAFASREAAAALQSSTGGRIERWADVLKRAGNLERASS
jgi:copper chaperone NosL